jgi:hypothetical protein
MNTNQPTNPFNPSVILDRFIDDGSDTSSDASSIAPTYSGDTWIKLDTVAKRALAGASKKDASTVRQSLHHMAIQNTLLKSENEGLLDALTFKKKPQKQSKSLALQQHYEYWGPSMMWTPRSFREAKVRMRLARQEKEAEEKEKANMKELAEANKLYNEKVLQEKRAARAKEKEERDRLAAVKAKEVAERKAERERQKQARDSQKAIQQALRGKRKASQKAAPGKKQNRGAVAARGSAPAHEPPLEPPATHSNRGRKIIRP